MWPFSKNTNRLVTRRVREGLAARFQRASEHGLSPVDVVSYDYLLGYIFAQLLVTIQYEYTKVRKGEEVTIGLMILRPFVGIKNIVWMRQRIESFINSTSSEAFVLGYATGNIVKCVAYGEKAYDDNAEVKEARARAPELRTRTNLADMTDDALAYVLLDAKLFDGWIEQRFPKA